jgi:hypothetical protein
MSINNISNNNELHTLIPFRKNEKFGYYNRITGKVEDINYLRASPFSYDLAHVIQVGWYHSILDCNLECLYMFAKGFRIEEIINPKQVIINLEDYQSHISETGLVDLTDTKCISNPPKDFIGKKPKIAYHNGCAFNSIFKDGLLMVNDFDLNKDAYKGKPIKEKLIAMRNRKFGYKNTDNHLVIDCIFLHAREFSEGIAAVSKEDSWGFINTIGELIIDYQFENVGSFSEGLCWFKTNNKYGFMDMEGNIIINPIFTGARDFSDGIAYVSDEKWKSGYFIDKDSQVIIPPNYSFFFESV